MRGGTLIIIGAFAVVWGFMPPISILCAVSGVLCVLIGIQQLKEEAKEETLEEEDKDESN